MSTNRKVRSMMRKPTYGPNGSLAWSFKRHWLDQWLRYEYENLVWECLPKRQLLHKGKKP